MMQELHEHSDCRLPPFLAYPRFLLKTDLPETAKLVYILLLNRTKLSRKNGNWTNPEGYVYIHYTIRTMAQEIGKCESTVKTAYRDLEKAGLIRRERQGKNCPNRIYVRLPEQSENCPADRQKPACPGDGKLSGNKKERNKYHPEKNYDWGVYL